MKSNFPLLKSGLFMLVALGFNLSANATAYIANTNGNYSSPGTWLGGTAPAANLTTGDNILINTGVVVNLDVDVTINNALASVTLNGTLSGTHNLNIQNGALSGTGTLGVHDLTFATGGSSTFAGTTTADDVYNSSTALSFAGRTRINDTLALYAGTVSVAVGDTLTLGSNAVIHTIGGTYTTGGGAISLLGNVNLLYTGTGTSTTGGEVSLPNINNMMVNLSSNSNQLNLSADVTVIGVLQVQSGSLSINGHTLTLNGTVSTTATSTLSGSNTSNLTLGGAGSMGTLMFTSGSSTLNNLTVNGSATSYAILGSDLTVSGVLALTNGGIALAGSSNLTLTGVDTVHGGSANSYVATIGTGSLIANIVGGLVNNSRMLPIGTSIAYAPVKVTNASVTAGNFSANVHPGIFVNGTTGTDLSTTMSSVNSSWNISSDITTAPNMTLEVFWSTAMEMNSFDRSNVRLSHYTNGAWDDSTHTQASVHAGGMASVKRTGITSFSPFAVFSGQALGINDVAANSSFSIYPNPALNTITVTVADPKSNDEVKVYDMTGNHVATYLVYNNNTIDINNLTSGMYFLSVNNKGAQKFVKQ